MELPFPLTGETQEEINDQFLEYIRQLYEKLQFSPVSGIAVGGNGIQIYGSTPPDVTALTVTEVAGPVGASITFTMPDTTTTTWNYCDILMSRDSGVTYEVIFTNARTEGPFICRAVATTETYYFKVVSYSYSGAVSEHPQIALITMS